jgi:hypothetical protein
MYASFPEGAAATRQIWICGQSHDLSGISACETDLTA